MSDEPRTRAERRRDTEQRLAQDPDIWVASASPTGTPYLVPLSFDWDGKAVLVATPPSSPTGRNLAATRRARLGLGMTRDVTMIDGEAEVIDGALTPASRGRYVARTGWNPDDETPPYSWFRIVARRVQAWREVNELAERDLMRDGRWLV